MDPHAHSQERGMREEGGVEDIPLNLSSQELLPRGNMKAARSVKPQGPARWGRVVGMHAAAPSALWATWDKYTCAGAALFATFSL